MKYLQLKLLITLSAIVIGSCQNNRSDEKKDTETNEWERNVSKRNKSITPENSYSALFLDSADVETFIIRKKLADSISRRVRSFYNTRNFQFAWFDTDGLTEQARSFWNLHEYIDKEGTDSTLNNKSFQKRMNKLIAEENLSVQGSAPRSIQTEIELTQHFISLMLSNYEKGFIKRKEMERFIPYKKEKALYLADSLIKKKHKDDKYFEDINISYGRLKKELTKYVSIAQKGGWQMVSANIKSLKSGTVSPDVVVLKKRLQATGDLMPTDTSMIFSDTLKNAIRVFQARHGYQPNGIVNDEIIREMNIPAEKRVQQILMNLGRMRWLPAEPVSDNLIIVNIPEFVLHMYEGKKKIFDMDVVVGKEGTNTTIFNGNLNQVVFSPYWNVPVSIVKNEVLPGIEKDPEYLAKQNMEITGSDDGLPVVRQLPGPKNALGKVKFLFPNSFDIYFHDTPVKGLFKKDKRAFSHGCIRLSDPVKMVQYLLHNYPEWTPERIAAAMESGEEKFVRIKNPVPVIITYYTSWVDEAGQLNFREDIYGHDEKLSKKMFVNPL